MKNNTNLGVPLFIIGSFWVVVIYGILVASLPFNPLSVPRILTINLQTICPQGWAFFTRNPREEQTYLYRIIEDQPVLQPVHNSRASNLFGAERRARLESMEIAMLAESVKADKWFNCEDGIGQLDSLNQLSTVKIRNNFSHPKICGAILLEKKEQVPWAWSKEISAGEVPSKIAKLLVLCSE